MIPTLEPERTGGSEVTVRWRLAAPAFAGSDYGLIIISGEGWGVPAPPSGTRGRSSGPAQGRCSHPRGPGQPPAGGPDPPPDGDSSLQNQS